MMYQFTCGHYKPTDYGVKRFFNTFKKLGRSYEFVLISKKFPLNIIDRNVIIITGNEPPIIMPSRKVFDKCFKEIIPNYARYGGRFSR